MNPYDHPPLDPGRPYYATPRRDAAAWTEITRDYVEWSAAHLPAPLRALVEAVLAGEEGAARVADDVLRARQISHQVETVWHWLLSVARAPAWATTPETYDDDADQGAALWAWLLAHDGDPWSAALTPVADAAREGLPLYERAVWEAAHDEYRTRVDWYTRQPYGGAS